MKLETKLQIQSQVVFAPNEDELHARIKLASHDGWEWDYVTHRYFAPACRVYAAVLLRAVSMPLTLVTPCPLEI